MNTVECEKEEELIEMVTEQESGRMPEASALKLLHAIYEDAWIDDGELMGQLAMATMQPLTDHELEEKFPAVWRAIQQNDELAETYRMAVQLVEAELRNELPELQTYPPVPEAVPQDSSVHDDRWSLIASKVQEAFRQGQNVVQDAVGRIAVGFGALGTSQAAVAGLRATSPSQGSLVHQVSDTMESESGAVEVSVSVYGSDDATYRVEVSLFSTDFDTSLDGFEVAILCSQDLLSKTITDSNGLAVVEALSCAAPEDLIVVVQAST